jgi:cyclopropane-fatty-acyl-phospholipid synthase
MSARGPGLVAGLAGRAGKALLFSWLGGLRNGRVVVTLPDGSSQAFGEGTPVTVRINDDRFFRRVLLSGDAEFPDSWCAGEWDTDNLTALLQLFASGRARLPRGRFTLSRGVRLTGAAAARAAALFRGRELPKEAEPPLPSRLPHESLATLLDPGFSFTAARFPDPSMTLAQAQEGAMERLLAKARVGPDHHLLVIGCGRSSFPVETARLAGCRVTALAFSRDDLRRTAELASQAGVRDHVTVAMGGPQALSRLDPGGFDRIIAPEGAGEEGSPSPAALFSACDRLLTGRRGIAVARVVAAPAAFAPACRRGGEWLRRRRFPGGELPTVEAVLRAARERKGLTIEDFENLAPHAARTCAEWRLRLAANRERSTALGTPEEARREWAFFFSLAEAAFTLRLAADVELILSRPGNPDLPLPPRRRF